MNREAIQQALLAIADAHGGTITPDLVVEAARDERSPLHNEFTWNDARAGQIVRVAEARALLARVSFTVSTTPISIRAPAFLRNPNVGNDQGYLTLSRVRADEEMARDVVIAEFMRAAAALRRARTVAFALGWSDRISGLVAGVEELADLATESTEAAAAGAPPG